MYLEIIPPEPGGVKRMVQEKGIAIETMKL